MHHREEISNLVLDRIQKLADSCTGLQNLIVYNAYDGRARSSLDCWMLECILVDYSEKTKISYTVWSYPQDATAVVEPYITVLRVHLLLEHPDGATQRKFGGRDVL